MIAVPFSNHFFIFIYLFIYVTLLFLIFTKTMLLLSFFFNSFFFFFMKITFIFLCSGMFRNVPGFIDAPHDRCRVPSVIDEWR